MINYHFCKHFIRHYLSATRIDVLHSPFVYDLYNSCIRRIKVPENKSLEDLRNALKRDQRKIIQVDMGAGSHKSHTKNLTVKKIASRQAKPQRIAEILYRILLRYNYKNCIELGTSLGITSSFIASALKKKFGPAEISFTTIEGAPEVAKIAAENFITLGVDKYISLRTGNFDQQLPEVMNHLSRVDFAFIDGNHRHEPTVRYFRQLLPKIHNESVLIFDDIYWSRGMTKAWKEIISHPEVRVSVDLFFIGLVFFRKEQAKENFKLRIW